MSTVSLPNILNPNVETINQPRFYDQFKKFDRGVFGFYFNEKSSKGENDKQPKEREG